MIKRIQWNICSLWDIILLLGVDHLILSGIFYLFIYFVVVVVVENIL